MALGVAAVKAHKSVYFTTLTELITSLTQAERAGSLKSRLRYINRVALLILDEMGYLPLSREDASLLFRLIQRRYEKASLILTSNKSFIDWGEIFGDQVLATAILDRLPASCHDLEYQGGELPAEGEAQGRVVGTCACNETGTVARYGLIHKMIDTAISLSTRGHFSILKSGHFNFLLTAAG